jgi:hypothetical protein
MQKHTGIGTSEGVFPSVIMPGVSDSVGSLQRLEGTLIQEAVALVTLEPQKIEAFFLFNRGALTSQPPDSTHLIRAPTTDIFDGGGERP